MTSSVATTPSQGGARSDENEGVLRIPQSSGITGTSTSDFCHIRNTRWGAVLPLCRDAVSAFYKPNRLGFIYKGHYYQLSETIRLCVNYSH